jgi:cell division septation protein DedD
MSRAFSVPVYILPSLNIPFFSSSSSSSSAAPSSPTAPAPLAAATTTATTAASSSKPSIARAAPDILRCKTCSSQLAFASQILSRQFTGRRGRAVLVRPPAPGSDLANVAVGHTESRLLATGAHTVADITCTVCADTLGWKYVDAEHKSQHYKIGCFILELKCVLEQRAWEDVEVVRQVAAETAAAAVASNSTRPPQPSTGAAATTPAAAAASAPAPASVNTASPDSNEADMASARLTDEWVDVQFDSSDERECDELFSGRWNADAVGKRRAKKGLFGK